MARLAVAVFWILSGLPLVTACAGREPGTHDARPRRVPTVGVEHVRPVDADLSRSYLVTVLPGEQADVLARTTGYVLTTLVDRGDRVRKGQRMALLDRDELTDQQRQAAAELAAAEASLSSAERNAERVEALLARNYASKADADLARTAVEVARAHAAAARAALAATRTRAGYGEIVAPFDGYVIRRNVDQGALVGPTGPALFRIGTTGHVKAVAAIPQPDTARLQAGAAVSLRIDGIPGRVFEGTISRFAPALDPATRTLEVEMAFDNPDGAIRPGMFGRATIVLDRIEDAIIVSPTAVVRRGPEGTAWVVREGRAYEVRVTLGRTLPDGRVEVLSGFKPGDAVVVAGRDILREGMEVRATESTANGGGDAHP